MTLCLAAYALLISLLGAMLPNTLLEIIMEVATNFHDGACKPG